MNDTPKLCSLKTLNFEMLLNSNELILLQPQIDNSVAQWLH